MANVAVWMLIEDPGAGDVCGVQVWRR
jgi:hypothetical protein